MSRQTERYSLVVYGATGFTGKHVVNQIAGEIDVMRREVGAKFSWAIAGRNSTVLNRMAADLGGRLGEANRPGVVVADIKDQIGLQKMAEGAHRALQGRQRFTHKILTSTFTSRRQSSCLAWDPTPSWASP